MSADELQKISKLYAAGKFQQVIDAANVLIARTPNLGEAYLHRSCAYYNLKKYEHAAEGFMKVFQDHPANKDVLSNLVSSLFELKRFDEMLRVVKISYSAAQSTNSGITLIELALKVPGHDDIVAPVFQQVFASHFVKNPDLRVAISNRISLRDWCSQNNVDVVEIDPAEDIHVKDLAADTAITYRSESTSVAVIPDATVQCGWDYVFAPTGDVLEDTGYLTLSSQMHFMPHVASRFVKRVASLRSADVININEDVLFLSCPAYNAFGHWLIDFLPRLMAWRRGKNDLKIFCPGNLPVHFKDTLALFGVQKTDLIEGEFYKTYKFKSVTVCRLGNWVAPSRSVIRFLYSVLGPQPRHKADHSTENYVFLERSQTNRGRYIANNESFGRVLNEFQVQTMRRPEVSIAVQNEILANAGIVIGAYGTDILAVYQLPVGADLIVFYFNDLGELAADGELDKMLTRICALIGVRLNRFYCSAAPEDKRAGYQRDLVVDCDRFRDVMREIVDRRNQERMAT